MIIVCHVFIQLLQVELVLSGQTAYEGVVSCFPSHISTKQKIPHSYKPESTVRFGGLVPDPVHSNSRGPISPSFGWAWHGTLPENERLLVGAVWVRVQSTSLADMASQVPRVLRATAKPLLSSSFTEARRRALNLYRAWYREVSPITAMPSPSTKFKT